MSGETARAILQPTTFSKDRKGVSDPFRERRTIKEDEDISPDPTTLWTFVRPYAWQYRWTILGALILNTLPGIAIAFQTLAPRYLVDDILRPTNLALPERLARLGILLAVYLFAALVFRMAAWYASYKIFTSIREKIVLQLRAKLFRHINQLCLRFHGKHSSGELFTYVMGSPLTDISMFFHNAVVNLPNCATTFLVASIWVFFWNWSLSLVLLVLVISTVFAMQKGGGRLQKLFGEYQSAEGRIVGRVADIFRGNRDVKIHAVEERMAEVFENSADQLRHKAYRRDIETHKVNMRPEALSYFCFVILCGVGTWQYLSHHLTEGQLVAFLAAYAGLQLPLNLVFTVGTMRGQAQAGLQRLREVLLETSSTPDPPPHFQLALPDFASIRIENLSFAYLPGIPVLREINLEIPFGERIAFVGPSGSGKSTLAKMLLRLYDPDEGRISFDQVDLRQCRASDLRRRFGVVPQDPYFFSATIRENLLLMNPGSTQRQLEQVCELANIWDFVEGLPDQLDTFIGESGARLSGGQRQRLAIARALLTEPSYLLFDEATSALDTVSERFFKEALARVLEDRTAIFIAHRLSTIKNCHRVLVVNEGRIVQDGTFSQLCVLPGLFRQMVESDKFEVND